MRWRSEALPLAVLVVLLSGAHGASAAYLQWNKTGDYVNFPFGSNSPAFIQRVTGNSTEKIVLVTGKTDNGWNVSALDAATGAVSWETTVVSPEGSNAAFATLTSGVPMSTPTDNALDMLFMQLGGTLVAVDPVTGSQMWQHTTLNASVPKITGHSGPTTGAVVYLTYTTWDYSRPIPFALNFVEALDASTGQLVWDNATVLAPNSGLPASDTAAAYGVTALPGQAVYAQGGRMYSMGAADGSWLWSLVVSTGASTGLAANVTAVAYVEPSPVRERPLLLLQTTNWDQLRFMAYRLNTSLDAPPAPFWQMAGQQNFEGTLNQDLVRLGLQIPQVDPINRLFVFWSNRTNYDPTTGMPVYHLFLVARSTETGVEMWSRNMTGLGLGGMPVSPPVIVSGVVSVLTDKELTVWEAASGTQRFVQLSAPVQPQATGGLYSYVPTTTFSNTVGQLAVVRCLGSEQPGSLCVYAGYERKPDASAAVGRQRVTAAQAVLSAALVLATWLMLI